MGTLVGALVISHKPRGNSRPRLGVGEFNQVVVDHLPALEPLGPLRQFRAEPPVLLENFAVMNNETTHEPDTHGSLERSLIHRLEVKDSEPTP